MEKSFFNTRDVRFDCSSGADYWIDGLPAVVGVLSKKSV